jgi:DDE superfamily endonuclease
MDETGLYYRCLPGRSYILTTGDERQIGRGTKAMKAKDHLTLVLCFNATGTCKISPLLIGTSKQTQCFRSRRKCPIPLGKYPRGSEPMEKIQNVTIRQAGDSGNPKLWPPRAGNRRL